MPRPATMISAALLTAAASGILPHLIGVNSTVQPLPLPGGLTISTQLPGPASGPSTSGGVAPPGPLPIPTPAPPNGGPAPGPGGLNATLNQGQSKVVSQTATGVITFQPDGGTHVGYLLLRNTRGWPQQVKIELALLQDRSGEPLAAEMKTEVEDISQMQAFELAIQKLRIVLINQGKSPSVNSAGQQVSNSHSGQDQDESVNPTRKGNTMAQRAPSLPGSGWLRIHWNPIKPDGTCKADAPDHCKELSDSTSLVPIILAEPPPKSTAAMGKIFFASLIAAGLVILIVAEALKISKTSLLDRMGSATWSFQQSWGANVTIGAGLLGTLLTLFAFPDHPSVMDKDSYSALQVLFAAIVTLAPLVYGLIRYDIQANTNGLASVDAQGYVIMFLLAGGLVLCGAIGQVATMGTLIEEFILGGRLQQSVGRALQTLAALLCVLLITYGLRSLYLTAKHLSADAATATGTQPLRRVQSGLAAPAKTPSPMAEWPLL